MTVCNNLKWYYIERAIISYGHPSQLHRLIGETHTHTATTKVREKRANSSELNESTCEPQISHKHTPETRWRRQREIDDNGNGYDDDADFHWN